MKSKLRLLRCPKAHTSQVPASPPEKKSPPVALRGYLIGPLDWSASGFRPVGIPVGPLATKSTTRTCVTEQLGTSAFDRGTSAYDRGTSAFALGTAKQRDKEEHKASAAKGGEANTGTKKLTAEEKKQKILAEDPNYTPHNRSELNVKWESIHGRKKGAAESP